ncbi:MAG: outer membrane lipoprotein carrier protein LolA [Bacteroidales bacterium]|nr:outer membrane lipoprotein carrier protein LolA [Bacteroidales bacterium]
MKNILVVLVMITGGMLFGQSAKKAEQLLEEVVNKTASYKNMRVEISYTMVNKEMDINEKRGGLIFISGDNYRIEMEGQIIISNGKTVWTYLVDSEEVLVSDLESNDENISPTKILTTYNSDYKARFDTDNKYKNADLKAINLRPNDGKQFEKMSLLVNQKNKSLESFSIYDKNGNVFTYHILKLTPNLDLPENTFTFNPEDYPDVEVVDMR